MAAATAPLARAAHTLSAQQLCDAAAAYSPLNCQEPHLFAALAPTLQIHAYVSRGALSAKQAAMPAWAYALRGALHGPATPALYQPLRCAPRHTPSHCMRTIAWPTPEPT